MSFNLINLLSWQDVLETESRIVLVTRQIRMLRRSAIKSCWQVNLTLRIFYGVHLISNFQLEKYRESFNCWSKSKHSCYTSTTRTLFCKLGLSGFPHKSLNFWWLSFDITKREVPLRHPFAAFLSSFNRKRRMFRNIKGIT